MQLAIPLTATRTLARAAREPARSNGLQFKSASGCVCSTVTLCGEYQTFRKLRFCALPAEMHRRFRETSVGIIRTSDGKQGLTNPTDT